MGKSKDTSCVSDTQNELSRKLENANVELEFQVLNYARENAHLKATYKNLFDSVFVSRVQTETKIASLQNELQCNIYKNVKLRTQLFKKVSDQKDNTKDTSKNTKFAKQPIVETLPKIDVISKVVCAMCKKCLNSVNHDICLNNYVNGKNFGGRKHKATVSKNETQKKYQPKASTPKKVEPRESLATPKPRKPRFLLRWSPTGRLFDQDGKLVASSHSESQVDCSNGCSKHMTGNLKLLINFVWNFLGTVRFGNDYVAAILGFGDLQWGNILITRVYFIERLGHNLFSVGQFCDSDLEVAF
nr:integrase, catalytic region, zinc finger, CCHC-type, peptidase aspartic, catalytic [Tanacetum cinerariifolium]